MSKKKSAKKSKAKVVETNEEVLENNELHLEFAEDETPESVEPGVEDATGEEFSEEALMATAEEAGADLEDSLIEDTEEEETLEAATNEEIEGSELESFESAEIEDVEHVTEEQIRSIVESVLFSTDKPISIALIKQAFKGTQVKSKDIREALTALSTEYIESSRGFTLDEIAGGFQLRTKPENMKYLRQSVKARPFKLSGPALEVLSIVAYKQPVTKAQIDEIRGVECGHLLRALMEKHLLTFGERSDLP
ncbi:MAG TPA: SMC-Scp complex subunit ScpB, partial [Bdellovibrionales bacterium]|nr:SMC-Scp complex subunit ScpB [Bdellovibrionales bacterium]